MAPKVKFEVSKIVNEFCHLSVLYSDLMPAELGDGILRNRAYQEKQYQLRRDDDRLALQKTGPFASGAEWYRFATGLMRRDRFGGFQSMSGDSPFVEVFRERRQRVDKRFEMIWDDIMPRLVEYQHTFSQQWSPISDRVVLTLQELTKTLWQTGEIRVHYIDCLYGGFGWGDCIGLTALPDMEVQKKLLTHELSELITPQSIIIEELQKAGLNLGITHTVVDMLAYFSLRKFLGKPDVPGIEKKGIRPNPTYYPAAGALFPFFERYSNNPSIYPDFESLIEDMISTLLPMKVGSTTTA